MACEFYTIVFDSATQSAEASSVGWRVASIPVLTHPTKNRSRFNIPNRDGELLGADVWNSNAFITCKFHSRVHNDAFGNASAPEGIGRRVSDLYQFLRDKKKIKISTEGGSTLDGYYEILQYNITNETRKSWDYAVIEVQFEVYPYRFLPSGDEPSSAGSIGSVYDDSMPLYEILSSTTGVNITLTVNSNTMTISVPSDDNRVFVDTRRQIAYDSQHRNVIVSGDYQKLYMKHGSNSLQVTGGILSTYPKWGFKL